MAENKVKFEDKKSPDKDTGHKNDHKKKEERYKHNKRNSSHYGNAKDNGKNPSFLKGGINSKKHKSIKLVL